MEWDNWESGDCLFARDEALAALDWSELQTRVSGAFEYVRIDREAGDRWVTERVLRAVACGYRGFLLDAERALIGNVVLVSLSDDGRHWVRFFLTPNTSALELNYDPPDAVACRLTAKRLAEALGYEAEYAS